MNIGENTAPLGVDRDLLETTDAVCFAGIRYIWDDGSTWTDDSTVWHD